MTVFIKPDITTDNLVISAEGKQFLEEELPGWHSSPGSVVDLLFDALAIPASEQAEVLVADLVAAFKGVGVTVGVEPIRAQPAHGLVTFTLADTAGHTLPAAGTVIGLRTSDGELRSFRLKADLVVAAGSSSGVGEVEDTQAGAAGNNLTGVAELIEAEAFIVGAVAGTTGGGLDEEEESVFLDRLTEDLRIQKPGPVRAEDAAVIARGVPGVGRATAVNLLKPAAGDGGEGVEETNVEKCVTVAVVKADGTAASAQVRGEVLALLNEEREVNFKFFVVSPHYTEVDVSVTVAAWPGFNLSAVKEEAEAALRNLLSPATWGTDATGNAARWTDDHVLRASDIYSALSNVPGVRWATAAQFALHSAAQSGGNLILSSSAVPVLPTAGSIAVAVEVST